MTDKTCTLSNNTRLGNFTELNGLLYNDQEFREEMRLYVMNNEKRLGYGDLHSILGGYEIGKCMEQNSPRGCSKLYCAFYHDFNYVISERLFKIYWRVHDKYIKSINNIIVDRKTMPDLNRIMLRHRELIIELEKDKLTFGNLHQILGGYDVKSCHVINCNKSICGYSHNCSNPIPNKIADMYFDIHKKFNEKRNNILRINYNNFLERNKNGYITQERSINNQTDISELQRELDSAKMYIQSKTEKWESDSKYIIDLQNDLRELKKQNVSFQIQLINLTTQLESKDNLIATLSGKINHQSQFDQQSQNIQYHSNYQVRHYEPQYNQYQMSEYPRESNKRQRYE
jgi:hypothetical protein